MSWQSDTRAAAPKFLYGILGKPLGHSLSPLLHNWAFRELGHPGAYFAWEKSQEELDAFFEAARRLPIAGLSVTIPHKEAVIPFLDALCPRAARAGAVNTVFWSEGRLMGDNTDVGGFLSPLQQRSSLPPRALILGAGGVCRAALAGLQELGMESVTVAARNPDKAQGLARDFNCGVIPWDEREAKALDAAPLLLINATPLGMQGAAQSESPLPEGAWRGIAERGGSAAYDLVYSPSNTVFLAHARAAGVAALDGLDFFVSQAVQQLKLWTEKPLPDNMEKELRDMAEKAIKQAALEKTG